MKIFNILLLTLFCLLTTVDSKAQQKLSRAQIQAKQANLPHKRPAKSKAEYDAILAKRKMEARQNKERFEREDRIRNREQLKGTRD